MCVSLSNFELIYVCCKGLNSSLYIWTSNFAHIWRNCLFLMYGLDVFAKSHLVITIKIYFSHPVHWTVPFSLPIPHCFDYSSFETSLKLNSWNSSFFSRVLWLPRVSIDSIWIFWFKVSFFRKGIRIFVIIALNLWTNFGNIDI